MRDREEAIVLDPEARDLGPQGHPDRWLSSNNLAIHLSIQYQQLGVMEDLDVAIILRQEVLDLFPRGHPDRWKEQQLRSSSLHQYNHLEATALAKDAPIDLRKETSCGQYYCTTPWVVLPAGATSSGSRKTFDKAIALVREALDLYPTGQPDRSMSLNNLALRLSTRYNRLGVMGDLHPRPRSP